MTNFGVSLKRFGTGLELFLVVIIGLFVPSTFFSWGYYMRLVYSSWFLVDRFSIAMRVASLKVSCSLTVVTDSSHEPASLIRSSQSNIRTDSSLLWEAYSFSWKNCFIGSLGVFLKVESIKQSCSSVSKGANPSMILQLSVILHSSLLDSSTKD